MTRSTKTLSISRWAGLLLALTMLVSCATVDLNTPIPSVDTGVDPNSWATIPAGPFLEGQFDHPATIDYDFEIMITDVTVDQYVEYLNKALADGTLKVKGEEIVGHYPGDAFHGYKHEVRFDPGDYIYVPLNDPASPFKFDGKTFTAKSGWGNHPMANVTWFGAWGYCKYHDYQLPTLLEWQKAARGSADNRPFPWGFEIAKNNANFYKSLDPFEVMATVGSRTSPVGFYNGKTYNGYTTLKSTSPYGLYDMAGNVWQWVADVTPKLSDRWMVGGSKDAYDFDLRVWRRNSAIPTYFSPGTGFRCVRTP